VPKGDRADTLWANLHLLFRLSLFPFSTGWMGENHFAAAPTAFYGMIPLMAAVAYWILQQIIINRESLLKKAIGADWRGKASPLLYMIAIPAAFRSNWISQGLYAFVALVWLAPDRRIEKVLAGKDN
jgi:uncharacterized membrane protein